ncbi:LamG-like jellyroll fold domain-containing protein [Flavobacterium gyeonganense]|uniref:LamG-like jellyroll fold domain-containing protein n=1 Tax=Flavobacterium gyeonganense TaxID=1310418 RepID=A0ABV5H763_9FLAO|nr:LamG-like jellyroll fold domain-containing protein [Flavobacterium gyeonganense]
MKQNYILASLLMLLSTALNAQSTNALNFDGVNDVVAINNVTTSSFTLEANIKLLNNSPTGSVAYQGAGIMDSDVGGYANDFAFSVLNNKLSFWDGSLNQTVNGNINLFDGNWHHVALVRDANVGAALYVDGVLDNQSNSPSSTILNANPKIYIGAAFIDNRYLNVDIAEVRIWSTARTATEINSNKSTRLTLPQTDLISYYKFNQGIANGSNTSETSLIDELGSNNGTLYNFTLTGTSSNWIGSTLTLSTDKFNGTNNSLQLYPNPSSDFIQVSELTQTGSYKIYTVSGTEVKTGTVDSSTKINIQSLTNGAYFLKLNSGNTLKFIKK